jgi:hypothetical protein
MGHGGAGERSVGAGWPSIERVAKSASKVWYEEERPCREWWEGLGTVTEALEGLASCGLALCGLEGSGSGAAVVAGFLFLKKDGGKCFALYFSCTLSSSCVGLRRAYKLQHGVQANLESLSVQADAIAQTPLSLLLDGPLIVL